MCRRVGSGAVLSGFSSWVGYVSAASRADLENQLAVEQDCYKAARWLLSYSSYSTFKYRKPWKIPTPLSEVPKELQTAALLYNARNQDPEEVLPSVY